MKIPTQRLLRAVSKKRVRGESSGSQRAPASKRSATGAPEPPAVQEPPVPPEIDLTADTPPEGAAMEEPVIEGPTTATEPVSPAPRGTSPLEAPRSWGEGPSGAASPPREPVPASGPPAEPENGGGAEGSGSRPGPSRDPLQVDGRWAEQALTPVFAPEVLEALGQLNVSAFFRESFANLAKLANSLKAAKEVIHESRALVRESRREANEALARAAAAEGALEAARTARAEELEAAERRVEAETNRRHAALKQMSLAEDTVAARDLHISELTSAMEAVESRAAEASEGARAAEERAKAAEERAKAAEERARIAEEEMGRAREAENVAVAALAAEEGARAIEVEAAVTARTAGVIEEYKASRRFMDDLADASAEVFLQGFQHGKEKVARDFNFPQALEVEPDHVSDSGLFDDEPAPTEP